MSSLIVPSHTLVNSIPIGRRLAEILKEKGAAYSQKAVANRLGMSRETLRLMLNGEREIYVFELEKIAMQLKLSHDRIMQQDILEDANAIAHLLKTMENPEKVLDLAEKNLNMALGLTEKGHALHECGKAYFVLQRYEQAHDAWTQAYSFAQTIASKYGDKQFLYQVLTNLMISYTVREEYSNLLPILKEVETVFHNDPEKLGMIYYTRAKISEQSNNIEEAREFANRSMDNYRLIQDEKSIGKAQLNAAHYEYRLKNYERAEELLKEAVANLIQDRYVQLIAIKEHVKALLKLGEFVTANEEIDDALVRIESNGNKNLFDLRGKLLLMKSISRNETKYAEEVLRDEEIDEKIRYFACQFLINYYIRVGDANSLMKYSKVAGEFSNFLSDILDEGDL